MKTRCVNPNRRDFHCYGGKGIAVCDEWHEYAGFMAWALTNGYRDDLTIGRKNHSKNYKPDNCEWTTQREQKRTTSRVRPMEGFGEVKILVDWTRDERCLVEKGTVLTRLRLGWSLEEAITTPLRERSEVVKAGRALMEAIDPISISALENENWKPIPGWIAYEASDQARLRTRWAKGFAGPGGGRGIRWYIGDEWRPMKIIERSDGRLVVSLCDPSKPKRRFFLSHLVLMAHVGPRPDGMISCHDPDPNPGNCRLNNLRWDTHSGNQLDRRKHDRIARSLIQGNQ